MNNISTLRKEGKLKEAYTLAQTQLQQKPNYLPYKDELLWVYYSFLKNEKSPLQLNRIYKIVNQIEILSVHDNQMFNDSFNWQMIRIFFSKDIEKHSDEKLNKLIALVSDIVKKQVKSESKSILIKALLKASKNMDNAWEISCFIDKEHFREEDFKPQEYNGVKTISIYEQAIYSCVKSWLNGLKTKHQKVIEHINLMEKHIISYHNNNYRFLKYYQAKILLAKDDKHGARKIAMDFLERNMNHSWAWDLMACCFDDPEKQIKCIAKGIHLQKNDVYALGLYNKMMQLYLFQAKYGQAAAVAKKIINIREQNSWKISKDLKEVSNSTDCVADSSLEKEIKTLAGTAMISVFENMEISKGVVIRHIDEKNLYFVINEKGESVKIRSKRKFFAGDIVQLYSTGHHKDIVKCNKPLENNYIKSFAGRLKRIKEFGFVDEIFIHPALLQKKLENNHPVKGIAIYDIHPKTGKRSWRAVSISKQD